MLTMLKNPSLFVRKRRSKSDMQLFDLMLLSRREGEIKTSCIHAIRLFVEWKNYSINGVEMQSGFYQSLTRYLLRRRARKAVSFYRIARRERLKLFQDYLQNLPVRNSCMAAIY